MKNMIYMLHILCWKCCFSVAYELVRILNLTVCTLCLTCTTHLVLQHLISSPHLQVNRHRAQTYNRCNKLIRVRASTLHPRNAMLCRIHLVQMARTASVMEDPRWPDGSVAYMLRTSLFRIPCSSSTTSDSLLSPSRCIYACSLAILGV